MLVKIYNINLGNVTLSEVDENVTLSEVEGCL
jgi:hypothetical protein